jgi:hypothetical protein
MSAKRSAAAGSVQFLAAVGVTVSHHQATVQQLGNITSAIKSGRVNNTDQLFLSYRGCHRYYQRLFSVDFCTT